MLFKMEGSSSTMRMRCLRRLVMKEEGATIMDGAWRIGKRVERPQQRQSPFEAWVSGVDS